MKDLNISIKDLYALCNRHRDNYLRYKANGGLGALIDTKCRGSDECYGWYVNQRRCGCGVKWGLEYDFDDDIWENIDLIDQNVPLGTPDKCIIM